MALPLFAVTMFISAFVLFLVQPMIGKMILPKLGGTPQVWNTCMVFFQSALLAGYAYAHFLSTRFPLRRQLIIHSIVLIVPIVLLIPPIGPFNVTGWIPPAGSNPIFATLALLAMIVGLPFFAVSTTAPLLQKWFSRSGHPTSDDPYYLYSASNIGSLLSLAAYPFVIEPIIGVSQQTVTWAVLYVLLAGLIIGCAMLLWKTPGALDAPIFSPETPTAETPVPPLENAPAPISTAVKSGPAPGGLAARGIQKKKPFKGVGSVPTADIRLSESAGFKPTETPVTMWRRVRWVLLAAIPSSLMLGVTAYVSTDLSPFPLLWAIPLSLYLISFILVFSRWPAPWTGRSHDVVLFLQPIGILGMAFLLLTGTNAYTMPMLIAFLGFFLTALAAHGELARDRPSPRHLTEFFLLMSFGGMLGGVFNGILAPMMFSWVVEYPLAIIAACFLRPLIKSRGWTEELLISNFPNTEAWAIKQGNELSARFKKPVTHSPYVLSWIFDVVLGVVAIVLLVLAIRFLFGSYHQNRPFTETTLSFMKILGYDNPTRAQAEAFGRFIFLMIPLVIVFFYASRPVRFGLAVFTLLWLYVGFLGVPERTHLPGGAKRTFFGVLRVFENPHETLNAVSKKDRKIMPNVLYEDLLVARRPDGTIDSERTRQILGIDFPVPDEEGKVISRSTSLTHGTTHHGQNFHYPPGLRRLATTYYHRMGPVGAVMERYNWFDNQKRPDQKKVDNGQFRYTADARLPAAMVAQGFSGMEIGLPLEQIAQAWSEPPIATIGLGSGTMASYGRPYQHIVFYEIDDQIRIFSEPYDIPTEEIPSSSAEWTKERMTDPNDPITRPYFTYLRDASMRGAQVDVIMGDARVALENEGDESRRGETRRFPLRQNYYKVMVIDAFSSDAIPVHLITEEAIKVYLKHLTDDGVICVHTSNRHVDLVQPVVNIAAKLNLDWRVGKDVAIPLQAKGKDQDALGHTSSEYVMLAKTPGILSSDYNLPGEKARTDMSQLYDPQPVGRSLIGWYHPAPPEHRVWTDDYSNILQIYR